VPGTGPRGHVAGHRRVRVGLHRAPLARPGRDQTLAAPVLGFITDPDFRPKAARVLDLYARSGDDEPLGADDYVISADEKTSIQARCRCHPTLAPGQARTMRVNHTYGRGGALAYLAGYDVHQATVFGRTEPATGIGSFMTLVTQGEGKVRVIMDGRLRAAEGSSSGQRRDVPRSF
jgi:hypothetical protein